MGEPEELAKLLGYRLRANGLVARGALADVLPAGLQDSAPRAAQLALHARVTELPVDGWADPSLCQVWGPRWSVYVVRAVDRATFTLGRLPRDERAADRMLAFAERAAELVGTDHVDPAVLAPELGVDAVDLRKLGPSGRFGLRWDASTIVLHTVDAPTVDPAEAQRELGRRYLVVFGPSDRRAFAKWAGIAPADATHTWRELADELTDMGDRQLLTRHLELWSPARVTGVRLLPSEDPFLRHDRDILLPDPEDRHTMFPSRPAGAFRGAVLVDGRIRGWWQRQGSRVRLHPFGDPTSWLARAVAEAWTLPVPGGVGQVE